MGTPVILENPNLSHFLNFFGWPQSEGVSGSFFAGGTERDETGRGVFACFNLDLASVQPITVAGLTIARASRRSGQKLETRTQTQRSDGCCRGRGVFRFSTARCRHTTKLSKDETANARISRCRRAMRTRMSIVRMAERLSGRWPDCQGFCGVRDFDEPQPDPGISRPDFEPRWFM